MGNRYTCKQTFEEWCIENNRQDLLDLWDYERNDKLPSEVPARTKTKYYFKCPNGIHESESRRLLGFTEKPDRVFQCLQCTGGHGGQTREDLTGQQFGNLTALYFDEEKTREKKITYWMCKCTCGREVSVLAGKLKSGLRASCYGKNRHAPETSTSEDGDRSAIRELRKTGLYRDWKKEVLRKTGGECVVCGSTQNSEYHHIYPFSSHPESRFSTYNGICLCRDHHNLAIPGSFHYEYGVYDNTPEQLEEYINRKRQELGINKYFDVYDYMNDLDSDNLELDDLILD